jgi:hypothetical protein
MRCLSDDVDGKYLIFIKKKNRSQTKEKKEGGGGMIRDFFH